VKTDGTTVKTEDTRRVEMKATISKEKGSLTGDYFVIKLLGVEMNAETKKYYPEGKDVCLRMSCSDYDWVDNPEALLTKITEVIRGSK
jgi:hypothetical protein